MARVTVEDCLEKVDNRFGLIHLAARRVRHLRKGAEPLITCKNKDIVVALREIAAGKVFQTEKTENGFVIENNADSDLEKPPETTEEVTPDEGQVDQEAMPEGK